MSIRRTRAKTADGLLAHIQRLILEEPKRYNQGHWLELLKDPHHAYILKQDDFPSCGTIGCVAGWAVALTQPVTQSVAAWEGSAFHSRAQAILGLTIEQSVELFSSGAISRHLTPGTQAYAKAGVKHIEAFRKAHRKQLRATKLAVES